MEGKYHISLNQFAEFSVATKKGKTRIIEQQVKPNPLLIPWYQQAKASIKRYLSDVNNYDHIREGIKKICEKKPENQRQASDKAVSLEVLKKIMDLNLEKYFKDFTYEAIKPEIKNLSIRNVNIGMSPELVFKAKSKGKVFYGGVKIHISKNKPFSLSQCQHVSTMLHRYIQKSIAKSGEEVLPQFCFCVDIFGDRIVTAREDVKIIKELHALCEEIKIIWPE